MQKIIKTDKATLLAVKLPEGASKCIVEDWMWFRALCYYTDKVADFETETFSKIRS